MSRPAARRFVTGLSAITFAVLFNVPYSLLAMRYDYPDILRRPAAEALDRFAEGGPALVLIWYGFALAALAFVPLAIALAVTPRRLSESPALSIGALIAGALAGVTQAMGLMRWVFVVPGLADMHTGGSDETRLMAESSFSLINAYGGVAIGEHMGQLLTALFVGLLASMQWRENHRASAGVGIVTSLAITIGAGEGLALALKGSGELFSAFTTAGFLGLTLWLILTGFGLIRRGNA
jgi:hypothetical protein